MKVLLLALVLILIGPSQGRADNQEAGSLVHATQSVNAHGPAHGKEASSSDLHGGADDTFSYHKSMLPLDTADYLTLSFSAFSLFLAAAGGIGAGGILVPLYMIIWKFYPKNSIALCNLTVLGGSIANVILSVKKTTPDGSPVIDWNIVLMMEPSTMAGAIVGSLVAKYLPDFVLVVCLSVILACLSYRTLGMGMTMFRTESEQRVQPLGAAVFSEDKDIELERLATGDVPVEKTREVGADATVDCSEGAYSPVAKIALLILCLLGCIGLTMLKSVAPRLGVACGSPTYYILSGATVPWVGIFCIVFRGMLLRERGAAASRGEIVWDSDTTVRFPLACIFAGVFAGLFGVGAGIVKGPLMLEMGVQPAKAAATAATMVLFTCCAAHVSFASFGLVEPDYGRLCFSLGFVCTAIGQVVTDTWMQRARRQSPPVLSIGVVMSISALLVWAQVAKILQETGLDSERLLGLFTPSPVCK